MAEETSRSFISQVMLQIKESMKQIESYEDRPSKERLLTCLRSIISASKLEGQLELLKFCEKIASISESILYGRLYANDNNKKIISDSLKEISTAIEAGELSSYTFNPALVQQMDAILKSTEIDSKDYVMMRGKIKILVIDGDNFAQQKIASSIDSKNIDIDTAYSAKDAARKLSTGKYDAVLCELSLPDSSATEILKQWSAKLPVVVMSSSDDTKIVQLVTKAGAADYIVKDTLGMRLLNRCLHAAANERKRIKEHKKTAMHDLHARRILGYIVKDGSSAITDTMSINTAFDPEIFSTDIAGTAHAISQLVEEGYLTREPLQMAVACPNCSSTKVLGKHLCKNCGGSDFVKGDIIEHNKCGHVELEFSFKQQVGLGSGRGDNDLLVCPKCRKELKLIGVDYFRVEGGYRCKICKQTFTSPEESYSCLNCKHSGFKLSQASWHQLFKYKLNPERIGELKRTLVSLAPLSDFLTERKFEVDIDSTLDTGYQTIGPFDIVARTPDSSRYLIISLVGSSLEESFAKIMEMDTAAKSLAGKVVDKYAVSFSEPAGAMRNLMNKFNVISIEVLSDKSRIVDEFSKRFDLRV